MYKNCQIFAHNLFRTDFTIFNLFYAFVGDPETQKPINRIQKKKIDMVLQKDSLQ